MARYDVHALRDGAGYLLDVQADLLHHIATRVVVPLLPAGTRLPPASGLNPVFEIEGRRHVMLTQSIAAIPVRELGDRLLSLDSQSAAIMHALDTLLVGF